MEITAAKKLSTGANTHKFFSSLSADTSRLNTRKEKNDSLGVPRDLAEGPQQSGPHHRSDRLPPENPPSLAASAPTLA